MPDTEAVRLELGDPTAWSFSHPPPLPSVEDCHLLGEEFLCQPLGVYPQWLKNSLGCFPFPHLTRKLKEREAKRMMLCQETNQGGQWCPEIPSKAACPFMARGGIPAPPISSSDGALEIPARKTLCWIKWHCSESGQRTTSLFCSWIYFRVTLTFTRTFT